MALRSASLPLVRASRRLTSAQRLLPANNWKLHSGRLTNPQSCSTASFHSSFLRVSDAKAGLEVLDSDGWIVNESDLHPISLQEENAQLRAEIQKLRVLLMKTTQRRIAALHWKPYEIAISAMERELRTRILNRVCKYGSFSTLHNALIYHDFLQRRLPEADVVHLLDQVVRYSRLRTWPEAMLTIEQIAAEFIAAYRVAKSSRNRVGDSEQAIVDSHTDHLLQLRFAMLNPDGFHRALAFRARFLQQTRPFKSDLIESELDFEAIHFVLTGDWDNTRLELDLLREQSAIDLNDVRMSDMLIALQAYLKEQLPSDCDAETWQLMGCLYTLASFKTNPDKPLSSQLIKEWIVSNE